MPTYKVIDGVGLVDKQTGERAALSQFWQPVAPYVVSDIPDYASPITGEIISGRAARREDLKKHNCIEVDPPKRPRGYKNPSFAKKRGLPLIGE